MSDTYRKRRVLMAIFLFLLLFFTIVSKTPIDTSDTKQTETTGTKPGILAIDALKTLQIKGRAPKTDYSREQFGKDWQTTNGCDTRNIILNRDMTDVTTDSDCNVISGILDDPYTGKIIRFTRGSETSGDVQIDHVVALSDAWQKGAQQMTLDQRIVLANDSLELLAVDGAANQQKGGSDAASWLPPNKSFRCQYISRQIAVKQKYNLWVTRAEFEAMENILSKCSGQLLPSP